ncbi:MAG: SDR family oxidoreductase [Zavarzinia sp.]|nr:SDR family oxidoreductase [Zavarzinia sp.]
MAEIAVVVGATGAFGTAITRRLAAHGLRVVAVGRGGSTLSALAAETPGVIPCTADIASDDAVARIAAALPEGVVRIAVHGPGLDAPGGIDTIETAALTAAVNVKAGGMLRLARAVDARLAPNSRLVAIAGHYGLEPVPYATAPGVANAALINLCRQLGLALGARGVTAHAIAPGPADTERLWRIAERRAGQDGRTAADVIDAMKAQSPIGALTTPDQVAWAVSLLLAPEAAVMTGSTLMLDAGRRHGLP